MINSLRGDPVDGFSSVKAHVKVRGLASVRNVDDPVTTKITIISIITTKSNESMRIDIITVWVYADDIESQPCQLSHTHNLLRQRDVNTSTVPTILMTTSPSDFCRMSGNSKCGSRTICIPSSSVTSPPWTHRVPVCYQFVMATRTVMRMLQLLL